MSRVPWRRWTLRRGREVIHDYRRDCRKWGHDYSYHPRKRGHEATMIGWGHGLEEGHYFLLTSPESSNRCSIYRIESVSYYADPRDMWTAEVRWCERSIIPQDVLDEAEKVVDGQA